MPIELLRKGGIGRRRSGEAVGQTVKLYRKPASLFPVKYRAVDFIEKYLGYVRRRRERGSE
jgi:hypothetical protein